MKYLLDTSVLLWIVFQELDKIPSSVKKVLNEESLVLSAVSTWEIAIKYRVGKLALIEHPQKIIPSIITRMGLELLPITHAHTLEVAEFPLHHNDPFDRFLAAQAKLEDLTLISPDKIFKKYRVKLLW